MLIARNCSSCAGENRQNMMRRCSEHVSTKKFKYYSHYTCYRMNTTIQLSKETKDLISTFGTKEDTYEDILRRMYILAVKEQLHEFLMSSDKSITLEEARKRHAKRWQG